jgi:hypothetical protein
MRTFDDGALSVMAAVLVAMLAWKTLDPGKVVVAPSARPPFATLSLDVRVLRVADAIAVAEGYYAPGRYHGRSLPNFLNNPGLLKASPFAGEDTATWDDTGLLVFPSAAVGWAALHHQVCLMLSGASRIYGPSDTLADVGIKYSGDANWGANVAGRLGVAPDVRLQDLAAGLSPGSPTGCRGTAIDAREGRHATPADLGD